MRSTVFSCPSSCRLVGRSGRDHVEHRFPAGLAGPVASDGHRALGFFGRSHVPLDKWPYAMYIVLTARKGVSSLQLSKEIGVTQKTAWSMLGRLREACGGDPGMLAGIVEADETFIGGNEKNKHGHKKLNAGRGTVGKTAVLGLRERGGRSVAMPIDGTTNAAIREQIEKHVEPGSHLHTDEHSAYDNLPGYIRSHVKHGAGEYVGANDIHVNSVESMWAVLKRGLYGTWHKASVKYLHRYVNEATFRLNEGNVKVHTLDRVAKCPTRVRRLRQEGAGLPASQGSGDAASGWSQAATFWPQHHEPIRTGPIAPVKPAKEQRGHPTRSSWRMSPL